MHAALSIANGASLNFVHGLPALLRTLAEFSLGALIYRVHSSGMGFGRERTVILTILLVGLAAVTRQDFVIVGTFGCLIFYGVNTTGALGRLLNARLSVALGNWSYSIYLWHAPTHYAVMAALIASGYPIHNLGLWSARLLLLATALGVVALSAVSYQYFETPARRLLLRATTDFGRVRSLRTAGL